jgi:hypothetical protein
LSGVFGYASPKKWHSQTSLRFTLPPLQLSVACLAM